MHVFKENFSVPRSQKQGPSYQFQILGLGFSNSKQSCTQSRRRLKNKKFPIPLGKELYIQNSNVVKYWYQNVYQFNGTDY